MANPFSIKGKLEGMEGLLRSIGYLKQSTQNKVLRPGVAAAGRLLAKAARGKVRRTKGATVGGWTYTGQLSKSIGAVVRTGKFSVYAVVGPRRGFAITVTTKGGKERKHDPANIGHLVEFGHRLVRGGKFRKGTGKVVGHVPPHPFLRPAFDETRAAMARILEQRTREALSRLFRKAAAAGKVAA